MTRKTPITPITPKAPTTRSKEVPHARDFLLQTLELKAFREFTLWSEHLVLHTRDSLHRFMAEAGFRDVSVRGFQRYGLSNHLYLLRHEMPGGHQHYFHLTRGDLDAAYGQMLAEIDQTDTLMCLARK